MPKSNISFYEFDDESFNLYLEHCNSPEAMEFGIGIPKSLLENPVIIKNTPTRGAYAWKLNNDKIIGFSKYDVSSINQTAYFSLYLLMPYRNNSYGSTCHTMMIENLFDNFGVKSIEHKVLLNDVSGSKMIEDYGFRYVGAERNVSLYKDNNKEISRSCLVYELTKSDFERKSKNKGASPRKSYGLHDPEFLASEKTRLGTQSQIDLGHLESEIDPYMKKYPSAIIVVEPQETV